MSSIFPEDNKFMDNGNYLKISKLPEGEECRIRIMGQGIVGWEDWTKDQTPIRYRPKECQPPIDEKKPVKKFFACVVWNYELEKIQIMSVTQKRVKDSLASLETKKGIPTNYDIKIVKTGEGKESQYTLMACHPTPVPAEAQASLDKTPLNLEALYDGKDPFKDFEPSQVSKTTGEVKSKAQAPSLQTLIDRAKKEHVPTEKLETYLLELASKGKKTLQEMCTAASQSWDKFSESYKSYLASSGMIGHPKAT